MRTALEMIPVLCRRAREQRTSRRQVRRFAEEVEVALEARREEQARSREALGSRALARAEILRFRALAEHGQAELLHLEAALQALQRFGRGGDYRELDRALEWWDAAHAAWVRSLRALVDLAPGVADRAVA